MEQWLWVYGLGPATFLFKEEGVRIVMEGSILEEATKMMWLIRCHLTVEGKGVICSGMTTIHAEMKVENEEEGGDDSHDNNAKGDDNDDDDRIFHDSMLGGGARSWAHNFQILWRVSIICFALKEIPSTTRLHHALHTLLL